MDALNTLKSAEHPKKSHENPPATAATSSPVTLNIYLPDEGIQSFFGGKNAHYYVFTAHDIDCCTELDMRRLKLAHPRSSRGCGNVPPPSPLSLKLPISDIGAERQETGNNYTHSHCRRFLSPFNRCLEWNTSKHW